MVLRRRRRRDVVSGINYSVEDGSEASEPVKDDSLNVTLEDESQGIRPGIPAMYERRNTTLGCQREHFAHCLLLQLPGHIAQCSLVVIKSNLSNGAGRMQVLANEVQFPCDTRLIASGHVARVQAERQAAEFIHQTLSAIYKCGDSSSPLDIMYPIR